MKLIGIGIDIEDISRFRKKEFKKNRDFYNKIFTKREIDYCLKKSDPYQHFAARYCAKEAFIKALHKKIEDFKSVEVILNRNKPTILWKGYDISLSLAHEPEKAVAVVIITKK